MKNEDKKSNYTFKMESPFDILTMHGDKNEYPTIFHLFKYIQTLQM